MAVNRAADVLNSESLSLVKLQIDLGYETVKDLLYVMISDVADFFNVGKTIKPGQIDSTIDMILDEYGVYKVDFFRLCFKRAMMGDYGEQYDRLDGPTILKWIREFEADYQADVEAIREREKKLIEKNLLPSGREEGAVPMPDYVKETLKNIGKGKEVKKEPDGPRQLSPSEVIAKGFIDDFLKIWNKAPNPGPIKMINHHGKILDLGEYMNLRMIAHEEIVRNEMIVRIENDDPVAFNFDKGQYESIYRAKLADMTEVRFYVDHLEAKEQGVKLTDAMNAADLIEWLVV